MQLDAQFLHEDHALTTENILKTLNSHIVLDEKIRLARILFGSSSHVLPQKCRFIEDWASNILIRSCSNYTRSLGSDANTAIRLPLPLLNKDLWAIYYESMRYLDFTDPASSKKEKISLCVSAVFSCVCGGYFSGPTPGFPLDASQVDDLLCLVLNSFKWLVDNCPYFSPSVQTICFSTDAMFKVGIEFLQGPTSNVDNCFFDYWTSTTRIFIQMLQKSMNNFVAQHSAFNTFIETLLEDALILRFRLLNSPRDAFSTCIGDLILDRLFHPSIIKSYENLYENVDYPPDRREWSTFNKIWILKPFLAINYLNLQPNTAVIARSSSIWLMDNFFRLYTSQYSLENTSPKLIEKSTITCWLYFVHIHRILTERTPLSPDFFFTLQKILSLLNRHKIYSSNSDLNEIRLTYLNRIFRDILDYLHDHSDLDSNVGITHILQCLKSLNALDYRILKDNLGEILDICWQIANPAISCEIDTLEEHLINTYSNLRQLNYALTAILTKLRQKKMTKNFGAKFLVALKIAYKSLLPAQIMSIWELYTKEIELYIPNCLGTHLENRDAQNNSPSFEHTTGIRNTKNFKIVASLFTHFLDHVQLNSNCASKMCEAIPPLIEQYISSIMPPCLIALRNDVNTDSSSSNFTLEEHHIVALDLYHSLTQLQINSYYEFSIGNADFHSSLKNYFAPLHCDLTVSEFCTRIKKAAAGHRHSVSFNFILTKINFTHLLTLSKIIEVLPLERFLNPSKSNDRLVETEFLTSIDSILKYLKTKLGKILDGIAAHGNENLQSNLEITKFPEFCEKFWCLTCANIKFILRYGHYKKHFIRAILRMAYDSLAPIDPETKNTLKSRVLKKTTELLHDANFYEIQDVHTLVPEIFIDIAVEKIIDIISHFGLEIPSKELFLHKNQRKLVDLLRKNVHKHENDNQKIHKCKFTNVPENLQKDIKNLHEFFRLILSLPLRWTFESFNFALISFFALLRESEYAIPVDLVSSIVYAISTLHHNSIQNQLKTTEKKFLHLKQKTLFWIYEYSLSIGVPLFQLGGLFRACTLYSLLHDQIELASWIGLGEVFCEKNGSNHLAITFLVEVILECIVNQLSKFKNFVPRHKTSLNGIRPRYNEIHLDSDIIDYIDKITGKLLQLTQNRIFGDNEKLTCLLVPLLIGNIRISRYLIGKLLKRHLKPSHDLHDLLESNLSRSISILLENSKDCKKLFTHEYDIFEQAILNFLKFFIACLPELTINTSHSTFHTLVALVYSLLLQKNESIQLLDNFPREEKFNEDVFDVATRQEYSFENIYGSMISVLGLHQAIDVANFLINQIVDGLNNISNLAPIITALDAFRLFIEFCNTSFSFQVLNLIAPRLINCLTQILQSNLWPLLEAPIPNSVHIRVLEIMVALIKDRFVFLDSVKLDCIFNSIGPVVMKQHSLSLANLLMEVQLSFHETHNFDRSLQFNARFCDKKIFKTYCLIISETLSNRNKYLVKILTSILLLTRFLLFILIKNVDESNGSFSLDPICANHLKYVLFQLAKLKLSKFLKNNLCLYLIVDYVRLLESNTVSLEVRKRLSVGIYALLDNCTDSQKSAINTALGATGQVFFKMMLEEYEKGYKFKGKI